MHCIYIASANTGYVSAQLHMYIHTVRTGMVIRSKVQLYLRLMITLS